MPKSLYYVAWLLLASVCGWICGTIYYYKTQVQPTRIHSNPIPSGHTTPEHHNSYVVYDDDGEPT